MAPPKKQFCVRGHDTYLVGRDNSSGCKRCKYEWARKWKKENPEKVRIGTRKWVMSGGQSECDKRRRDKARKNGTCTDCGVTATTGYTQCESCRSKANESARLANHFGMSVTIIRELGLDKNLPVPRRENADR